MTHKEQETFIEVEKGFNPEMFTGVSVLEFGSFNVNGSVRHFFDEPSRYVGVDWRPGPDVDEVALFHEFRSNDVFDVFISCNAFEHDPYWKESLVAGISYLRKGGLGLVVCAAEGTPKHYGETSPQNDYYENVSREEMEKAWRKAGMDGCVYVQRMNGACDIVCSGRKM